MKKFFARFSSKSAPLQQPLQLIPEQAVPARLTPEQVALNKAYIALTNREEQLLQKAAVFAMIREFNRQVIEKLDQCIQSAAASPHNTFSVVPPYFFSDVLSSESMTLHHLSKASRNSVYLLCRQDIDLIFGPMLIALKQLGWNISEISYVENAPPFEGTRDIYIKVTPLSAIQAA